MDILGESPEVTLADVQTGSAPAGITREWMENMVYSSSRKVLISSLFGLKHQRIGSYGPEFILSHNERLNTMQK